MSSCGTVCMVAREPMPAIEGLMAIRSGAEVSLIPDSSSLMTVADPRIHAACDARAPSIRMCTV